MPFVPRKSPGNVAILLAMGLLLASCGGDGDSQAPDGGGASSAPVPPAAAAPTPPAPACAATSTCQLTVAVVLPDKQPAAGASVSVTGFTADRKSLSATTDASGIVHFGGLPRLVWVSISHPFGRFAKGFTGSQGANVEPVAFPESGSLHLSATLEPHSPPTIALLPATIPASSIAADRRSLELRLRLVASGTAGFHRSSLASSPDATPYLRFNNCQLWLERGESTPFCRGGTDANTELLAFRYLPRAAVSGWPSSSTVDGTLLLFEQSQRSASSDPHALRSAAGRMFVRRAVGGEADAAPDLPERNRLAVMAAVLEAPLVAANHPDGMFDGLYAALGLAADLNAGAQLPTMEAVFRLHAEPGMSFQSGSNFRGTLYTESESCPMGCAEQSFEFEVRIP